MKNRNFKSRRKSLVFFSLNQQQWSRFHRVAQKAFVKLLLERREEQKARSEWKSLIVIPPSRGFFSLRLRSCFRVRAEHKGGVASALSARNRGNVAKINICENNGASGIGTDRRRAPSSSIESLENSIKSPFNPTFEQSFDRRQFLFFFFFPLFQHFSMCCHSFVRSFVHSRSISTPFHFCEQERTRMSFRLIDPSMIVYFWKMERNSFLDETCFFLFLRY